MGPTGADLLGASAHLLAVADVSGMAPGAKIGSFDPRIIAPNAEGAARIAPLAGDIGLSEARTSACSTSAHPTRAACNDCEHARRPQWLLQRCDHSGHNEEVVTEEAGATQHHCNTSILKARSLRPTPHTVAIRLSHTCSYQGLVC